MAGLLLENAVLVFRLIMLSSVKSMQKRMFGWFIKLASRQLSDCLRVTIVTCHCHQKTVLWNWVSPIHVYKWRYLTCSRFIYFFLYFINIPVTVTEPLFL